MSYNNPITNNIFSMDELDSNVDPEETTDSEDEALEKETGEEVPQEVDEDPV